MYAWSCASSLFFSSRRRHTRSSSDWSSDVCSSDLIVARGRTHADHPPHVRRGQHHRIAERSEKRRVGEEGRSRWSPYHLKKKKNKIDTKKTTLGTLHACVSGRRNRGV